MSLSDSAWPDRRAWGWLAAPGACDGGGRRREETRRGRRRRADGIRRAANELAELPDHVLERRRLRIEFLGRAGAFLGAGRIALSHLIHLGDGGVDLFDALGLFAGGRRNFGDQRVGGRHLLGDLRERFPDLGALRAVSTAGNRRLDLVRGFLGGGGAALGQRANFVRDHRKAGARLAGARRFHRGIQRQDVRLEGDLIDVLDDLGDLGAGRI